MGEVIKIDEHDLKLNLNQATYEDLLCAKGITPKLAKKIIEYRLEHGPFRNAEELKDIKGIGEFRYEKLKNLFLCE